MTDNTSMPPSCCLRGSTWSSGAPTGRIGTLAANRAYIAGTDTTRAVLLVHDLLGWTFPNTRLLADAYAAAARCTVYVPDFFGGEPPLPFEPVLAGRWAELDVPGFVARNGRDVREGEVVACTRALKETEGFEKVGAVGFCYGGWAVFRLGAREFNAGERKLVDCITAGHPSLLTADDIDAMGVPVQVLAPEHDPVYTMELKKRTFEVGLKAGVPFDYQHFPGVEHACFVRGDEQKPGERDALVRAKDAVVVWLRRFLDVE